MACLVLGAGVTLAAGCRARGESREPGAARLRISAIELGRAVDLDKRVKEPTASFSANDTIYASVLTQGEAPLVALTARWRRAGDLLEETTQMIAPRAGTASEFHVWKPHGWPKGDYEVEILVDGVSSGRRTFSVD